MKSLLDNSFEYVPADKMGPDYLRKKFAQMMRAKAKETAQVVEQPNVVKITKQGAK